MFIKIKIARVFFTLAIILTMNSVFQGGPRTDTSGFLSSLPINNTVFVAKNGSDATGLVQRLDKPFLTIAAARTAALAFFTGGTAPSSTNRILIQVYSGYYTEPIVLDNFIDYDLADCVIERTGGAEATINDSGAACNSIIYGSATIIRSGGGSNKHGVNIKGASNVTINCNTISSSVGAGVQNLAATLNIKCNTITSTFDYGVIASSGVVTIYANTISSVADTVANNTGTVYVYANLVSSAGVGCSNVSGNLTIIGDITCANTCCQASGNGTVIVKGNLVSSSTVAGAITTTGAGSTQIIYGNVSTASSCVVCSSTGTINVYGNLASTSAANECIIASSGTVNIYGNCSASIQKCVLVSGGTIEFFNSRIVVTAANQSAINKSSGILKLNSVTIIATGTGFSITSPSAQTVLCYGASQTNKAVNTAFAITLSVGFLTVDTATT